MKRTVQGAKTFVEGLTLWRHAEGDFWTHEAEFGFPPGSGLSHRGMAITQANY